MTWEQYAIAGYRYEDYLKLSQFERLKYVWARRGQTGWPGHFLIVFHVWPFCLRFGFDQSQELDHFWLGPIEFAFSLAL